MRMGAAASYYRRVAFYGVGRLLEAKRAERRRSMTCGPTVTPADFCEPLHGRLFETALLRGVCGCASKLVAHGRSGERQTGA